jgi:hypothetical protein
MTNLLRPEPSVFVLSTGAGTKHVWRSWVFGFGRRGTRPDGAVRGWTGPFAAVRNYSRLFVIIPGSFHAEPLPLRIEFCTRTEKLTIACLLQADLILKHQ